MVQHCRKAHGLELSPKNAGSGGKQKYADVDLDDDKITYVPIDNFKQFTPIFEVVKCKERNQDTGQLKELTQPKVLNN